MDEQENTPNGDGGGTYYDALFEIRDAHRERVRRGIDVVRGDELPWEDSRQGRLKWFLHPRKRDTVIDTLMVWEQEIPPGGRTGKQHVPGGVAHYFLEGSGYSVVDGVTYRWKAGDALGLPIAAEGVVCQHFNASDSEPARFLAAMPNLTGTLGMDLGSRFEHLEPAPDTSDGFSEKQEVD